LYRFVFEFATVFVVGIISGAFFKEQGWPQRGWRTSLTLLGQVGGDNIHVVYPHTGVTANGNLKKTILKKVDSKLTETIIIFTCFIPLRTNYILKFLQPEDDSLMSRNM
jgi:hypothetical protein